MDSMKAYFDYIVRTRCGIPEVRLEGTHEDWTQLAERTEKLGSTYELQWWTERMMPRLEAMAVHSNGQGSPAFWRDIYKWNSGSGGPFINGWIVDFIPYVTSDGKFYKNWLFRYPKDFDDAGMTTDTLPSSLSTVPFIWDYLGTKYEMEFVAGFMSFTQETDSFAVRPKVGWAVRDKSQST